MYHCFRSSLVIYGNNLHKNIVFWFSFHGKRPALPFTFAAAGLPLSRPWYWQGWHQRRALTPGELGLPAVSNQVYFEVRDTRTPRAKAATSPVLHTPHQNRACSLQAPPGTADAQHSCITSRCCNSALRALYLRGPHRGWWHPDTERGNAANNHISSDLKRVLNIQDS